MKKILSITTLFLVFALFTSAFADGAWGKVSLIVDEEYYDCASESFGNTDSNGNPLEGSIITIPAKAGQKIFLLFDEGVSSFCPEIFGTKTDGTPYYEWGGDNFLAINGASMVIPEDVTGPLLLKVWYHLTDYAGFSDEGDYMPFGWERVATFILNVEAAK